MSRTYDSVWQRVRLVVLARDGGLCRLKLRGCTVVADCVDHIIPVSEGGARLDLGNLRASCTHCNLSRVSGRSAVLAAALSVSSRSGVGPSREW